VRRFQTQAPSKWRSHIARDEADRLTIVGDIVDDNDTVGTTVV
jgi:hypothetical protein